MKSLRDEICFSAGYNDKADLISSEAQPKISSERSEDFIAPRAISLTFYFDLCYNIPKK